jgi:hypothetical protein
MTRSKFIAITLGVFCGLGVQFQASAVNAQTAYGQVNGIANITMFPGNRLTAGGTLTSPAGVRLVMQYDGNLVIYNQIGAAIWASYGSWFNCAGVYEDEGGGPAGPNSCPQPPVASGKWWAFFGDDGDLVINYTDGGPNSTSQVWDTGTYANGAWQYSNPGQYLSLQDNGDLVIYDADLNVLWAASWLSNFNFATAQYSKQICSC